MIKVVKNLFFAILIILTFCFLGTMAKAAEETSETTNPIEMEVSDMTDDSFIPQIAEWSQLESTLTADPVGLGDNMASAIDSNYRKIKLIPSHPFYFLRRWREKLTLFFTFDKTKKTSYKLSLASQRLVEAWTLKGRNSDYTSQLEEYSRISQANPNDNRSYDQLKNNYFLFEALISSKQEKYYDNKLITETAEKNRLLAQGKLDSLVFRFDDNIGQIEGKIIRKYSLFETDDDMVKNIILVIQSGNKDILLKSIEPSKITNSAGETLAYDDGLIGKTLKAKLVDKKIIYPKESGRKIRELYMDMGVDGFATIENVSVE